MKYVSASEGLGGSLRINLLHKVRSDLQQVGDLGPGFNRRDGGWETSYGKSRLYLNGSAKLSASWEATYYFEFQPDADSLDDSRSIRGHGSKLEMERQDLGLRGPIGWLRVGRIETVSHSILPSADLTNDVGTTGRSMAEDIDNGISWTSPDMNGLQFGASVKVEDRKFLEEGTTNTALAGQLATTRKDFKDENIDQWDVAIAYSLTDELSFGASYAKVHTYDERATDGQGFRTGVRYGRSSWRVAYNFHKYKAVNINELIVDSLDSSAAAAQGFGSQFHYSEFNSSQEDVPFGERLPNGIVSTGDAANDNLRAGSFLFLEGHPDTLYTEHVVGANLSMGKLNFALNYSMASTENSRVDVSSAPGLQKLDYEVKSRRLDIGYKLGAKTKIVAAYRSDDHAKDVFDSDEYYLMYRLDI